MFGIAFEEEAVVAAQVFMLDRTFVEFEGAVHDIGLEESVEVEICEYVVLALVLGGEREIALFVVAPRCSSGRS